MLTSLIIPFHLTETPTGLANVTRYVGGGAGPCRGGVHRFMVASSGALSEGYRHDGPGVCLGDGQTEAYLMDMGMTGLASAWAMARRRPI